MLKFYHFLVTCFDGIIVPIYILLEISLRHLSSCFVNLNNCNISYNLSVLFAGLYSYNCYLPLMLLYFIVIIMSTLGFAVFQL